MKPLLLLFLSTWIASADIAGEWNLRMTAFGDPFGSFRMRLEVSGSKLSGTFDDLTLEGRIEGTQVFFSALRKNGSAWGTFEGNISEGSLNIETITGTMKSGDGKPENGVEPEQFQWTASRPAPPSQGPKTVTFEPTAFPRAFTGTLVPVLRLHSGDSVKTRTVDAGGVDASGKRRSIGGNPETGPFYIEEAMPGDTLAVRLTRVRLNRNSAVSGDTIVPTALNAGYYRDAKFDDKFNSDWTLDLDAGIARLAKPTDRLKNFRVQLQPMLGCVGVAPPSRQTYRSGWLGPFGGNMDYKGVKEGTTVYLPVFQEGALLFVGDGHAEQGDGELNGDALETSMDVEFHVEVIRGSSTQGPRFEDAEYLMASGIAGSMQDAFQRATTELAKWIEKDYKLTPNESNVVLGTSIQFDIAEVVDPQIHVVAKIRKSTLATIQ